MPELPEVEVVKKSLEKEILNLTIKDIKIRDDKLRYKVKKSDFSKIIGSKILKITRRSKYLLFLLNNSFIMIAHLGMTGKFFLKNENQKKRKTSFYYDVTENDKKDKHDRLIFTFNKNLKLIYNDVRKFGFIKLISANKINLNPHIKLLGPEPFNDYFDAKYFKSYLVGRNRVIKDLLMDQKFVAGLGNIYVNEILFLSGISPNRNIRTLKSLEINSILKNTRLVLKKAILLGGSSIKNFSNSSGKEGNFQQHFNVYGRKGVKCSSSDCKGIIKKIIISNRASFFCSICQK